MSWQECTAIPGKSYSAEVGMTSAAKRSVVVKKIQTCAIINSTSIVGSGEPMSDRGVPINQPLQRLLSATNSIGRSLSSFELACPIFLLVCSFHLSTFSVRLVTLSERNMRMTSLQRQLSMKYRQLSLAIVEQNF